MALLTPTFEIEVKLVFTCKLVSSAQSVSTYFNKSVKPLFSEKSEFNSDSNSALSWLGLVLIRYNALWIKEKLEILSPFLSIAILNISSPWELKAYVFSLISKYSWFLVLIPNLSKHAMVSSSDNEYFVNTTIPFDWFSA